MTLSPADLKSLKIVEAATSTVSYSNWGRPLIDTLNTYVCTVFTLRYRITGELCRTVAANYDSSISSVMCYPANQTKSLLNNSKTYQYSYPAAVTSTPSKNTGIFIKTYKDREKQKEDEKGNPATPSIDSTATSGGAVDMYGPGIGDYANNISDVSESREFSKHGGLALFDDII